MSIIKERCAEESDGFVDSIINLIQNINNRNFDFERERDIASKKLRDLSKCILKKQEY